MKPVRVSTAQYKAGTTSYRTVITAHQATALNAQQTAVNLQPRRLVATVVLIQALGGGWDASHLPTQQELRETH